MNQSKVRVYFLNELEEPTTLLRKLHQKSLEITHKHTWNPRRWSFFLPFYRRVAQRLLLLGQQVRYSHNTDHTQTEWTHLHQTAKANQVRFLFQGMWFTGAFPSQVSGKAHCSIKCFSAIFREVVEPLYDMLNMTDPKAIYISNVMQDK